MIDLILLSEISHFTTSPQAFQHILLLFNSYNNIFDNFEDLRNDILCKRVERLFNKTVVNALKSYDIGEWLNSSECEYMLFMNIRLNNLIYHVIECIRHDYLIGIKYLFNIEGFNPNIYYDNLATCAYDMNRPEMLKFILSDCRINPTGTGMTAISRNDLNWFEIILNSESSKHYSPFNSIYLISATRLGRYEILNILLENPRTDITMNNYVAIHNIITYNHFDMLELVVNKSILQPEILTKILFDLINEDIHSKNNQIKIAEIIMCDVRINPLLNSYNLLHLAIRRQFIELIMILFGSPYITEKDFDDLMNYAISLRKEDSKMSIRNALELRKLNIRYKYFLK